MKEIWKQTQLALGKHIGIPLTEGAEEGHNADGLTSYMCSGCNVTFIHHVLEKKWKSIS